MGSAVPTSVDDYLAALTPGQREWIDDLRATIRAVIPEATEEISYGIVAFKLRGKAVVWYAAYKAHFSMHPASDAMIAELGDRLKPLQTGKGTIRFDPAKPVPKKLVRDIVRIRRDELEVGA